MVVAVPDPAVLRLELTAIGRRADRLGDLLGTGPDVGERDGAVRAVADRLRGEIDVDAPRQRVGDAERRRAQVARAHLRMDAPLEVPVAGQDGHDVELLVLDRRADVVGQRSGVADARGAAVADEREPELLQVRREARLIEVLGHHARARRQAGLDPRLRLQPGLDRLLRQETRGHHDRWVRRVRATRDRGDDDGSVAEVVRLFVPPVTEHGRERRPHVRKGDAILGALRSRERRNHGAQIQIEHLSEDGIGVSVVAEQSLRLGVALDDVHQVAATGEREVAERLGVDGEVGGRGAVLRTHVGQRRAVGGGERGQAVAEELDEPADDAVGAQHLREREHQVGRRGAGRKAPDRPHADHERLRHEHRLSEHRGLRLDAAGAPAEHAQAVDHGRVRVRPDDRVGERDPVANGDHLAEMLEVHLVADPRSGRYHAQAVERLLRPAQEGVTLGVALVLPFDVGGVRPLGPEQVHLHRVVDDEVGGDEWVDLRRIAAVARHRRAHRGEVHHRGDAGQVLHQDAAGHERDVPRRSGPGRQRPHVVVRDVARAGAAEQVLQQDLDGLREAADVAVVAQVVESVDVDGAGGGLQRTAGAGQFGGHRDVASFLVTGLVTGSLHPPTRERARFTRRGVRLCGRP